MLPAIFSLIIAVAPSAEDGNAAVMYIQSYVNPALVRICKVSTPESATEFDAALATWQETNRKSIARGELVLREQTRLEGKDFDKELRDARKLMVDQLESMAESQRRVSCADILEVLRDES